MNTKLLRQKILDLAIRGKLTEQKKSDGTTKDLLAQISKQWLVSSKQDSQKENASSNVIASTTSTSSRTPIRDPFAASKNSDDVIASTAKQSKKNKTAEPKQIIPLDKSEAPFEIPENWEWVKLGDVGVWQAGTTPSKANSAYYKDGTIPWLNTGDLTDGVVTEIPKMVTEKALAETSLKMNEAGSVCIAMYGATIGKLGILAIPATTNQACCVCNKRVPFVEQRWLFYFLMFNKQDFIEAGMGGAQPNISKEKIVSTYFPLPPLAEQKRIVEAIESAFAEITAIENNQELLKKHIKQGRQKILDLAIRGKLTQQLKTDGATKDLLTSIATASACHAELVSASPSSSAKKNSKATERSIILSKRSVSKDLAKEIIPLDKDEAPFEIPETWEWVRLGDLCSSVSSGKTPSTIQKELWNGDILWVTSKDVKQKYIHSTQVCLSELGAQTMRLYPENTMIIVGRSGILRHTLPVSILKHDATINQDLKALIFKDDNLAEYIHAAIKGMEQDLLHRYKKAGTTVDNLNFDEFLLAGIPLPPLAEQQRIVAAIESAFTEFDAMEKGL